MGFFDIFGKSNPETQNIPSPDTKASLGELWNNIKKPSENNTNLESIKDYVGKGSENQDVFYIVVAGDDGVFTTIRLTKIGEKVFEFSTKDKNKYNLTFRDGVGVNQQFSTSLPTGYRVHGMVFPVTTQYAGHYKSNSPYTYVPYTPYEPMLNSPEKKKQGLEYLKKSFASAHEVIQQKNLPSQAFKGKKVHEVIPPWLPMMFNIVEHMDSDIYIGNQKTDTLKPRSETWKIMDDKIGEVFYQYSTNKGSAYNYSKSGAGALGTAQIMPKPYEVLSREHYPKAGLNPSFIAGMQDHQNAMMTQILWFDDILKTFPDEFKEEYLKWINGKKPNIDIAGILGASYNSGTTISAKLRKGQQWDTIFNGLRIESQIYFHKTRYVRQQLGKEYGTAIPDSPNIAKVGLEYQDESIIAARLKRKIPKGKKQSPELAREQAEMGHYPAYKTYEDIERGLKNSKLILVSPSGKGYALAGIGKYEKDPHKKDLLRALDPKVLRLLEEISRAFSEKFPNSSLPITSLARPQEYYDKIPSVGNHKSKDGKTSHMRGGSFDIGISRMQVPEQVWLNIHLKGLKDKNTILTALEGNNAMHVFLRPNNNTTAK